MSRTQTHDISTAIIKTHISDHYSIAAKINLDYRRPNTRQVTKTYKHIDYELLNERIMNTDGKIITDSSDVNFAALTLTIMIQDIDSCSETRTYFSKCRPLKTYLSINDKIIEYYRESIPRV